MLTDKYIIQELCDNSGASPEFRAMYEKFAKRVLWMDGDVVPGAFQMNTAWYFAVPERDPVFDAHTHDFDELIGFFGSDPASPYDLGAELEVTLGGEKHVLTRSAMIFVPAGLEHMPLSIKRVDRPVFHLSVAMAHGYHGGAYK